MAVPGLFYGLDTRNDDIHRREDCVEFLRPLALLPLIAVNKRGKYTIIASTSLLQEFCVRCEKVAGKLGIELCR